MRQAGLSQRTLGPHKWLWQLGMNALPVYVVLGIHRLDAGNSHHAESLELQRSSHKIAFHNLFSVA